jgi:transposase
LTLAAPLATLSVNIMDTTPEVAAQVVACTQLGHSQRCVAQQLNLSRSAVRRVYRRFQDTGSFNRRPGAGRRRYTSERDDRFIELNQHR